MAGVTIDTPQQRPLRSLNYSLTRADALAYARLRGELTGWGKLGMIVLVAALGFAAGWLPDTLPRALWWVSVAALALCAAGIAIVWARLETRRKAALLDPAPGGIVLELWDDHLIERSSIGERRITFDQIAQVIETPDHVFVRTGSFPIVIPASAFENDADIKSFAGRIDDASERAQP